MKKTVIALSAIIAMLLPVVAGAHHSFTAEYDATRPVTLLGVINKIDQQNPHGFIYLNVTSANGRVTNWALETPGPNQLVRNGFTRDLYQKMIDSKEQVTVKGYIARDGSKRAFAETLTRADGRTVITISVGGVAGAVGRAPQGDNVVVDGVAVPDSGARGGGGGRGGNRGGAPQGAPQ